MTITLVEPVEVDQIARVKGGLLDVAHPAPAGWEHGLGINFYGCGEPTVRGICVESTDVLNRQAVESFGVFTIEQTATCTTNDWLDQSGQARSRLEATTEWALGQQLQLGVVDTDSPSLADATVLGTIDAADFVHAVSCLEQAAADAGYGTVWTLHAPVRAAAYLKRLKMLDDGLSPTGQPWIISPGYTPQGDTTIRLWATGPVWVGVSDPVERAAIDRRLNDDTAYSDRLGIVAFDPCMNIAIDVTVPACP